MDISFENWTRDSRRKTLPATTWPPTGSNHVVSAVTVGSQTLRPLTVLGTALMRVVSLGVHSDLSHVRVHFSAAIPGAQPFRPKVEAISLYNGRIRSYNCTPSGHESDARTRDLRSYTPPYRFSNSMSSRMLLSRDDAGFSRDVHSICLIVVHFADPSCPWLCAAAAFLARSF